jgi:hypothetical protein
MIALGRMNAPVESSAMSGVLGDDGFEVITTLAKCVGTPTFGGEPMTSCVCHRREHTMQVRAARVTDHTPLAVRTLLGNVERYGKDVHVLELRCQAAAPVLEVSPVCISDVSRGRTVQGDGTYSGG